MRRLPIFFVLDCSESMVGENLRKMEEGVVSIVKKLRSDPHALETVYFSIIPFAGKSKTLAPLVELANFYPPRLPLGGGTNLGSALDTLMQEIDKSVIKTTLDKKGDWRPIVYLWTDGKPTDNPDSAISRWNASYAKKTTVIAIGLGKSADLSILKRITENVLLFEGTNIGDFDKFIRWVTETVVSQSKSVGDGLDAREISNFDSSYLKLIKEVPRKTYDASVVTFVGRCQKTKKPYIIKYEQEVRDLPTRDFNFKVSQYDLAGCYVIDEEYFVWSESQESSHKVNTNELIGTPGCPHCGAQTAFAACSCGNLMCINEPGDAVCPWCKQNVSFLPYSARDDGGFDINRGRG